MDWFKATLSISTRGKGLFEFTRQVTVQIQEWEIQEGMCFLFMPHTSASMVINESYDPSARRDLETFMDKLVPEGSSWHEHTLEGPDDSPSHMRTILTNSNLTIPIDDGELNLGTWQGIYVFEHRRRGQQRKVHLRCFKYK